MHPRQQLQLARGGRNQTIHTMKPAQTRMEGVSQRLRQTAFRRYGHLLVCRIVHMSASISADDCTDALQLLVAGLQAPKAASALHTQEHRYMTEHACKHVDSTALNTETQPSMHARRNIGGNEAGRDVAGTHACQGCCVACMQVL
jgi:hypothetical protein